MSFNSTESFIHCCFGNNDNVVTGKISPGVEVYFAKTKEIISEYSVLEKYIDKRDKLMAYKLHFDEDRYTYLFCHTLLRLFISKKLKIDPSEISVIYDKNNKPGLKADSLFFNISHTREAFAFAISDHSKVGIDIEKVDRNIDFKSIINNFFSKEEREFILESPVDSRNRFFLLWTRKEAFLKVLGVGIINNLEDVEVFRDVNNLNMENFGYLADYTAITDQFIYSIKLQNYFISLATPQKVKINLHKLDAEMLNSYM